MSTNRNIVEMVEAIRKGTGGSNSADGVDGTYMADVLSVKPLTIKMHNTTGLFEPISWDDTAKVLL